MIVVTTHSNGPTAEMTAHDAASVRADFRVCFSRVSNMRGLFDVVGYWGSIVLVVALAHVWGYWLGYAVAFLLMAGWQHALITLQHDAWHRLCFTSKRLNDFVGAWLYAYSVGMPYYHERRRHLAHHRRVGHEDDPDWINYTNQGRVPASRLWRYLFGRLIGSLLKGVAGSLLWGRKARVGADLDVPTRGPSLFMEYVWVAVFQLLLLSAFALFGFWWEYFLLWALPLATVTSLCVSLRAFLEHAHPENNPEPVARLYDFRATPVERFFVSPCHFNYHALHHAFPTIPHGSLPLAHRAVNDRGIEYPGVQRGSYWRFLSDHLHGLAALKRRGDIAETHTS